MKTTQGLAEAVAEEMGYLGDDAMLVSTLPEFARRLFALRDAEAAPVGYYDDAEPEFSFYAGKGRTPVYTHAPAPSEAEGAGLSVQLDNAERENAELRQQLAESQAREKKLRVSMEKIDHCQTFESDKDLRSAIDERRAASVLLDTMEFSAVRTHAGNGRRLRLDVIFELQLLHV